MTRDDFTAELDRRGGDLPAWPQSLRTAAEALLACDAQARAQLAAAQEVEAWLAAPAAAPQGSPPWLFEVTARPQAKGPASGRRLAAWGAAAAACLVGGLLVGAGPHVAPEPSEVLAAALGWGGGTDAG